MNLSLWLFNSLLLYIWSSFMDFSLSVMRSSFSFACWSGYQRPSELSIAEPFETLAIIDLLDFETSRTASWFPCLDEHCGHALTPSWSLTQNLWSINLHLSQLRVWLILDLSHNLISDISYLCQMKCKIFWDNRPILLHKSIPITSSVSKNSISFRSVLIFL